MFLVNHYRVVIIFSGIFACYYLIGLSGYGTDEDTFGMIRSGQQLLVYGHYRPSRVPSYLIPEVLIGFTSLVGSFYLSNLISAVLGIFTLYLFFHLLKNIFSFTEALLVTLVVGLNPFFVIASSSSIDYIYSLFFCICGIILLNRRRYYPSALMFALALSSRLSNVLLIVLVYAYFFLPVCFKWKTNKRELRQQIISLCILSLLTALLYMPAFAYSGYNFGFLTYAKANWTFIGHLFRFIYKNTYLFGLLPSLLILLSTVYFVLKKQWLPKHRIVWYGLGIIVVQEVLFFKIPYEISYLLPLLFVIIPIWTIFTRPKKSLLILLLLLTILYNFINIDVLDKKYNETGTECIDAKIGLFFRPGILISDIINRDRAQKWGFEMCDIPVKK